MNARIIFNLKNLKFGRETDNIKVIEKSSGSKKGE